MKPVRSLRPRSQTRFFPFLFSLLLLLLFFVCLHFQLLAVESTVREAWDLILCIYIFISICGDSGDIIIRGRWTLLIVFVSYLSLFFFFLLLFSYLFERGEATVRKVGKGERDRRQVRKPRHCCCRYCAAVVLCTVSCVVIPGINERKAIAS